MRKHRLPTHDEMLDRAKRDYGREVIVQALGFEDWAHAVVMHYLVQRPPNSIADDTDALWTWHIQGAGTNGAGFDHIVHSEWRRQ